MLLVSIAMIIRMGFLIAWELLAASDGAAWRELRDVLLAPKFGTWTWTDWDPCLQLYHSARP